MEFISLAKSVKKSKSVILLLALHIQYIVQGDGGPNGWVVESSRLSACIRTDGGGGGAFVYVWLWRWRRTVPAPIVCICRFAASQATTHSRFHFIFIVIAIAITFSFFYVFHFRSSSISLWLLSEPLALCILPPSSTAAPCRAAMALTFINICAHKDKSIYMYIFVCVCVWLWLHGCQFVSRYKRGIFQKIWHNWRRTDHGQLWHAFFQLFVIAFVVHLPQNILFSLQFFDFFHFHFNFYFHIHFYLFVVVLCAHFLFIYFVLGSSQVASQQPVASSRWPNSQCQSWRWTTHLYAWPHRIAVAATAELKANACKMDIEHWAKASCMDRSAAWWYEGFRMGRSMFKGTGVHVCLCR